jgi:hypothetical protein
MPTSKTPSNQIGGNSKKAVTRFNNTGSTGSVLTPKTGSKGSKATGPRSGKKR